MKLIFNKTWKHKGKQYGKWVLILPNKDVEKLRWREGDEIVGTIVEDKGYFLSVKE